MSTTHNTRKKIAAQNKATVMAWLQWDELAYATFQYECGLAYLGHYITHDKWGQDMLQRSAIFWNWWKLQWDYRDTAFCDEEETGLMLRLGSKHCRSLYYHLHNPATLASDIYPNRVVLDESYNQMIHSLINETSHA